MKTTKLIILAIVTMLTMTFTSCNKDDEGDTSTTATLKVNVTVEDYGIISGVKIDLIEEPEDTYIQEKLTDTNGKVTFTNILPGTYSVESWYFPNSDVEHTGFSGSFQLIAGETKTMSLAL